MHDKLASLSMDTTNTVKQEVVNRYLPQSQGRLLHQNSDMKRLKR